MKKDRFEELIVVKRSGQRVNFNSYKIAVAIKNAFDCISSKYNEKNVNQVYEDVLKVIESDYSLRKTIKVEEIQDIIESELKRQKYLDVYREFSQYRQKRAESRQAFTLKQQHKFARAMEKISTDDFLRSNHTYKPHELLIEYGNTVVTEFVKSYILDSKYLRMFEEGNIYINNLTNASLGRVFQVNISLQTKLETGTNFSELLNYLIELKDEVDGEIHISNFDLLLKQYFWKKIQGTFTDYLNNYINILGLNNYLDKSNLVQIIKASDYLTLLDNLNETALNSKVKTLFKAAFKDALVKEQYNLSNELNYFLNHLNRHSNYSFSFGKGNDELQIKIISLIIRILNENKRLEKVSFIYKITGTEAKYLEDIFKLIKARKNVLVQISELNQDVEYYANGIKIYDNYNDLPGSSGRMVISQTSLNMARLGLIFKNSNRKQFYDKLGEWLDLVKSELLLMFETIGNKTKDNYHILFDNNIKYDEKLEVGGRIRKVIKNSNLLIGLVGLKECVELLESETSKQYDLLKDILKFVNLRCQNYHAETKLNFYPFEPYNDDSPKYFMALDKSIYGIQKGITDKIRYDIVTNLEGIKNDYCKIGNVVHLLTGGNLILKEIKETMTFKSFKAFINKMAINQLGIIRFERGSG